MGDMVEGVKETEKATDSLISKQTTFITKLKETLAVTKQIAKEERGASASQIANRSSTTGPTANNGGGGNTNGYSGNNPFSATQAGPFSPGTAGAPPKFSSLGSNAASILKGLGGAAIGLVGFLPTVEEATTAQLMKSRMSFYGRQGQYPSGHKPPEPGIWDPNSTDPRRFGENHETAYRQVRDFSNLGTALTPSDAQAAINNGIQMGFLPSLKNYGMGKSGEKTGFSGILGGAALASNLSPGIGLQGGMQVMGSLNQAQNVNMLRMLGVQVRNSKGNGMNDLPEIIEQIYNLLARGGDITVKDIATSLMPGNALDSMLNQYLGGDVNLKNAVISGLIQRVKSGKSLRTSGTKSELIKTGGSSLGVSSISARSTAELGLIQSYSDDTVVGMNTANQGLTKLYSKLASGTVDIAAGDRKNEVDVKKYIQMAQNLSTKLDVYTGARNNAGQAVLQSIVDTSKDVFDDSGPLGKAVVGGLELTAGIRAATHLDSTLPQPAGSEYGNNAWYGSPAQRASASNPGTVYTGTITVNVAAPPGQDPYSYGLAIGKAMTARS